MLENIDSSEKLERLLNYYGTNEAALAEIITGGKKSISWTNKLKKMRSGSIDIPSEFPMLMQSVKNHLDKEFEDFDSCYSKFRFIDLFAGIGGFRLAFDKAGGKCVFTSEWDEYPRKIYRDNFPGLIAGDITKIHESEIPQHDILVAGFPCQPFSIAGVSKKNSMGREHGFACDTQGTLFFDVARIIKHHKPKMFLLENVKNLKSHDKGNTFKVILNTLEKDLGYKIWTQVIDGANAVPQHRERIYIVGSLEHNFEFNFPKEFRKVASTVGEILEKNVDPKYTLSDKLWAALQRHANKHKAKGNGFGYGLCKKSDTTRTLSARYYKDGGEILIEQRAKNPRRLTPRECARLMGYDDSFKIDSISDTRAYKCFGNSVVVPIVESIASEMVKTPVMQKIVKLNERKKSKNRIIQ